MKKKDIRELAFGVLIIGLCGIASFVIRHESFDIPGLYLRAVLVSAVLYAGLCSFFPLPVRETFLRCVTRNLVKIAVLLAVLVSLAYALKLSDSFSRLWSAYWLVSSWLLLSLADYVLSGRAPLGRKILIGDQASLDLLRARILSDQAGSPIVSLTFEEALEWLATQDDVSERDEVLLAGPPPGDAERTALILALHGHPVELRYCLDLEYNVTVPLLSAPGAWDAVCKRIEDLLIGIPALLTVAPVMAVAAVLVWLSGPGPILFRQRRLGFGGKAFTILKFRTMVLQAGGDAQAVQAGRDDMRVTRVGAVLRRWGIDELPQLLNVLKGDMSLVGPRPHAFPHDVQWGQRLPRYGQRFRVRPGITGLAQISGRRGYVGTEDDIRARVDLDLEYIRTWSVVLDLKIMIGTVPALLRDDGQVGP